MRGCPIASLPDYRKIVLRRLPENSTLDDAQGILSEHEIETTNPIMSHEDTILLKELVADGLLVSFKAENMQLNI